MKFLSAGFLQNKQEETLKQNFFSGLEPIRTYHDANVTFLNKKIDKINKWKILVREKSRLIRYSYNI